MRSGCSSPVRCRGRSPFRGVRLGVPICEDIWKEDVVECLEETGAEILIVPNGSPYCLGKNDVRTNIAVARVVESGLPLAYVNQVCGQDELVFEGASFVLNADRTLAVQMPAFEEMISLPPRWTRGDDGWVCADGLKVVVEEDDLSAYLACVLGPPRLRQEERLSRRRARPLRRRRQRPRRGDRGGCARAAQRARADAALPLHLDRKLCRRRKPAPRRSASTTTSCRSSIRSKVS